MHFQPYTHTWLSNNNKWWWTTWMLSAHRYIYVAACYFIYQTNCVNCCNGCRLWWRQCLIMMMWWWWWLWYVNLYSPRNGSNTKKHSSTSINMYKTKAATKSVISKWRLCVSICNHVKRNVDVHVQMLKLWISCRCIRSPSWTCKQLQWKFVSDLSWIDSDASSAKPGAYQPVGGLPVSIRLTAIG